MSKASFELSAVSNYKWLFRRTVSGLMVFTAVLMALPIGRSATAATFRVDDTSLTVPGILGDDWRAVQHKKIWAKSDGQKLGGDPRFLRFLAREYSFTSTDSGVRLKTTWFASGKCVTTDESVKSLSSSKKKSIESVFGSLRELSLRMEENPDIPQGRVVIWAHFKSTHEASLPLDSLSAEDSRTLAPFADLAQQAFETRLSRSARCRESKNLDESRNAARSGGRRMRPSKSQSGSSSSRRTMPPRPTGGLVAGALPEAAPTPARPDRRMEDNKGEKQKWAILISKFEAKAGSLVFKPAGQFTRCVTARSEADAIALMRTTYRPRVAPGNGKRISYTISPGGGGCGDSSGGSGGPTESEDSGVGTGSAPSTDGEAGAPGESGPFEPVVDPLDINPSSSGNEEPGELNDFDLESIPASEDFESETLEGEPETAQPSTETVDSTEE